MSSNFERIDSETLFDGKFFAVERGTFRHEDGEVVTRELVTHPGAVGIVVLDGDTAVVRPPAARGRSASRTCSRSPPASSTWRARTRSRPAAASSPRRSASRPPTGSRSAPSSPRPGFADEIIHLFLATGISDVDERPEVEEDERIDVELRPLSELDAILTETRTPRRWSRSTGCATT